MNTSEERNGSLTLDQRLAEGPLSLTEALRYAALLAEEVRQIHDSGSNCGALMPSNIAVTATGLGLHLAPHQPAAVGRKLPGVLQDAAEHGGELRAHRPGEAQQDERRRRDREEQRRDAHAHDVVGRREERQRGEDERGIKPPSHLIPHLENWLK